MNKLNFLKKCRDNPVKNLFLCVFLRCSFPSQTIRRAPNLANLGVPSNCWELDDQLWLVNEKATSGKEKVQAVLKRGCNSGNGLDVISTGI